MKNEPPADPRLRRIYEAAKKLEIARLRKERMEKVVADFERAAAEAKAKREQK
jgi:hypothetical protein